MEILAVIYKELHFKLSIYCSFYSELPNIVRCVKEHTGGCAASQNAPLEWILRKYKEWQQSSCDLSRVDPQVMVVDDSSELANCSMMFMNSFYKGLTTKTDFMQAMCQASEEEQKCMRHAKHIPLSVQFNLAEDMDKYMEFNKMCNRSFTTLPAVSGKIGHLNPRVYHIKDLKVKPG